MVECVYQQTLTLPSHILPLRKENMSQPTYGFGLMIFFANGIGVNMTYCVQAETFHGIASFCHLLNFSLEAHEGNFP